MQKSGMYEVFDTQATRGISILVFARFVGTNTVVMSSYYEVSFIILKCCVL